MLCDPYVESSPLVNFVNISVVRAGFCTKFDTAVKQKHTHFNTKSRWNVSENDKNYDVSTKTISISQRSSGKLTGINLGRRRRVLVETCPS